jgi:AhpC/TSA antioxidant enzyme
LSAFVPRIHAAGGELLILGNGTPEQAAWFVEDYKVETPVVTDPQLRSHAIVGARRANLFDPRPAIAGLRAMRHGFRQTKTMGSAGQLGGVFVIEGGRMPYRYLSAFAGDHPEPEDAVRALEAAGTA